MKGYLIVFVLFLTLLFLPSRIHAFNDFSVDNKVSYTIDEEGNTRVLIKPTLTNLVTKYYASSYTLEIGLEHIENVKAFDETGLIKPKVEKKQNTYQITIPFNTKVVGKGNSQTFSVSFDTPDVTRKRGQIWEISIPGVGNIYEFAAFDVSVNVPQSFGIPTYTKPYTNVQKMGKINFKKEQIGKSEISITFGKKQIYAFQLKYHLQNDNEYPIKTEIALPPATNYQDVYINRIHPKPVNIIKDQDGNWLALYSLRKLEKVEVTVEGDAVVFLSPKQEELSPEKESLYLESKKYWEAQNSVIQNEANKLKNIKDIYEYVVQKLTYDFSRVTSNKPRLGALSALQNPKSAVCLEFTDLFIALSRAKGIPARQVEGYAFTQNRLKRPLSLVQDILHAWPEYYDKGKKTWIMVDPTWGNTTNGADYFNTFDFDHFTFVIKGMDSMYPISAGGYKQQESITKKDILISFGDSVNQKASKIELKQDASKPIIAGLAQKKEITIINNSNFQLPKKKIIIQTNTLRPLSQTLLIDEIPPFGSVTKEFSFEKTSFLTNKKDTITMRLDENVVSSDIQIIPFFLTGWGLLGGGVGIGICAVVLSFAASKTRRVSIFR